MGENCPIKNFPLRICSTALVFGLMPKVIWIRLGFFQPIFSKNQKTYFSLSLYIYIIFYILYILYINLYILYILYICILKKKSQNIPVSFFSRITFDFWQHLPGQCAWNLRNIEFHPRTLFQWHLGSPWHWSQPKSPVRDQTGDGGLCPSD